MGVTTTKWRLRFMLGLSPAMLQQGYLADPTRIDLSQHRAHLPLPHVNLCAGVIAAEVTKAAARARWCQGWRHELSI